jgi:hypothetical protein
MIYYYEKDLDEEHVKEFREKLNPPHLQLVRDKPQTKGTVMIQKGKWKAPPGWTPPGWNETKSYQAAKSFMVFQTNPK